MKNKIIKIENKAKNSYRGLRNKGFTIVETLIAISILAIALTGPLSIVSQSLKSSYFARDLVTALYLAQEAVEYIRNRRDQNGLQKTTAADWLNGLTVSTDTGENILNDVNSSVSKAYLERTSSGYSLKKCTPNGDQDCPAMTYDPNTRIYGEYTGGLANSVFTREIIMAKSPGDPDAKREIIVSVRVSWNTSSISNSVVIDEHLYNWQLELQPIE